MLSIEPNLLKYITSIFGYIGGRHILSCILPIQWFQHLIYYNHVITYSNSVKTKIYIPKLNVAQRFQPCSINKCAAADFHHLKQRCRTFMKTEVFASFTTPSCYRSFWISCHRFIGSASSNAIITLLSHYHTTPLQLGLPHDKTCFQRTDGLRRRKDECRFVVRKMSIEIGFGN